LFIVLLLLDILITGMLELNCKTTDYLSLLHSDWLY